MFKKIIFCLVAVFSLENMNEVSATTTQRIIVETKSGDIKLEHLLAACPEIANCTPCKRAHKEVVEKIIQINHKTYEIRFFGFEDTGGKLSKDTTFKEYAAQKNLLDMASITMNSLPGIHFESFDYRKAHLEDGVYFSMAVPLINPENL